MMEPAAQTAGQTNDFGLLAAPAPLYAPPVTEGRPVVEESRAVPAAVSMAKGGRLFGLDVIRATAIGLVLLAHTFPRKAALGLELDSILRLRNGLGFLGVELFFVLSGFLIGGILLREMERGRFETGGDLVHFWKRRWMRTLPIFLVFLGLNLGVVWMESGRAPAGGWRFLTFTQGFAAPNPSWFREAWSLSVEEWFYLLFPISLFTLRKVWRRLDHGCFLLCTLLFLLAPMFIRLAWGAGEWDNGVRKITVLRLDAIMFGVAFAYLSQQRPGLWSALRRGWPVGLLGALGVLVYLCAQTPQAGSVFDRVFLFSLTSASAALLLPGLSQWSLPRSWLARPIVCLSLWSYSLYLCHGLVNTYLRPGCLKITGFDLGKESPLRAAAVWVVAIAVSALLYRFVEKPITNLREKPWNRLAGRGGNWKRLFAQAFRYARHRAAITFYLTAFAQAAALVTSILLARTMAVEGYGQFLYALSWATLVSQVGILGFDRLAVREVAANLARHDLATLHGFIRFVFKWELLLISAGSLGAYGVAHLLERIAGVGIPAYFGWAMLIVPPLVLLNLQLCVVRGANRVVESQLPEKLLRPLAILGLVGTLFFIAGPPSVPTVLAVYGVSALLGSLWAWRDLKRFIPARPEALAPVFRPREWMQSSLHLATAVLMFTINARADSLLLGMLNGATALALYLVALRISQSTSLALGIFNVLLGPNISSRHARADHAGLQQLAGRYARAIVAANLLTLVPVVLLARPIVGLFGEAFLPAVAPLLLLCVGQFFNSLAGPAGSFLVNCGQEALSARILGVTCAVNIGLNLVLIPKFGASGAAAAGSAGLLLKGVLMVWGCLKRLRINPTIFPGLLGREPFLAAQGGPSSA